MEESGASPQDPFAVIEAVIDGDVEPEKGAATLLGRWLPIEDLGPDHEDGSAPSGHRYSLRELDGRAHDLLRGGEYDQGLRLAELNWLLSERVGAEELSVECAATLAQALVYEPSAVRRRLELLEYAVPKILTRDLEAVVKGGMCVHLAEARFNAAGGDPEYLHAAIAAARQAIEFGVPKIWAGKLLFILGTAHSEVAEEPEGYLTAAACLKQALDHFDPAERPEEYGSALHNLGNACRYLGELTRDPSALRAALACFDKAMPYRRTGFLADRTRSSRAMTERTLRELTDAVPADDADDAGRFFRAGREALAAAETDPSHAAAYIDKATRDHVAEARTLGPDAPAEARAVLQLGLAQVLLHSDDEDARLTGVCFAAAARRLGAPLFGPGQIARLDLQVGHVLFRSGLKSDRAYLPAAERRIAAALPLLKAAGSDEYAHAREAHLAVLASLADGDDTAWDRAVALSVELQRERLAAETRQDMPDPLRAAYRAYLTRVEKAAGDVLATFIAEARVRQFMIMGGRTNDRDKAIRTTDIAWRLREVGDLTGALEAAAMAEGAGPGATVDAPPVWCRLALFYGEAGLKAEADRVLETADEVMRKATDDPQVVLDTDYGWIPHRDLGVYQDEIDEVRTRVAGLRSLPRFDAARTAELLIPDDGPARSRLRQALEGDQ